MIKISFTKMSNFAIPLIVLFLNTSVHASYNKLAKAAGISQYKLLQIVKKVVKIETPTGAYNITNPKTGAYGRYQILPATARFYSKKLNIPMYKWKKPYNQERIFKALMKDNIKSLKKRGYKVSAFTIYATHQQGAAGFNRIMKNKRMSYKLEKKLRRNLPKYLRKVHKSKLRLTWIRYWKNKLA